MIFTLSYISKIKTVACHNEAKSFVSEVKLCFRNSQIPYLKAKSIFKKSFVVYGKQKNFLSKTTKPKTLDIWNVASPSLESTPSLPLPSLFPDMLIKLLLDVLSICVYLCFVVHCFVSFQVLQSS